MKFLRGVLWFACAVALVAVAMWMTGNFEIADRLTGLFLQLEPYLPAFIKPDSFSVALTVLSVLLILITIWVSIGLIGMEVARGAKVRQQAMGQLAATKRELDLFKTQNQQHFDTLLTVSQALAKRLDKRVIIQGIVDAASRLTSMGQSTNSLVSCWLLHIDTDTIRFEMGKYCDEAFFTKTEFQPAELPFAKVINLRKTWIPTDKDADTLIKPEKSGQLGAASARIVVPLVVEETVLGFLVIYCHPDIVKGYEAQRAFYEAFWTQLYLALAIAIQGEVAILDRLTGVHNREYFMKRFIQEIERANRFQLPLSLLMIDIDNFKAVNDTLGHPQGDAVLKIIAKIIKKEVRAIDLAGRYGGEEFIIMLPETGGDAKNVTSGAMVVAERIRKAVYDEFAGMQKPLALTISVGAAARRFPQDKEMDHRELIRIADEQLYKAKTTGKNKVYFYEPEQKPEAVT